MATAVLGSGTPQREILFDEVLKALRKMPKPFRHLFVMAHYQGKRPPELARKLGLSEFEVLERLEAANRLFYRIMQATFSGTGK